MMNKKLYAMLLLASLSFVTQNNAADTTKDTGAPSRASKRTGRAASRTTTGRGGRTAVRRQGVASATRRRAQGQVQSQPKTAILGTDSATYTPQWLPQSEGAAKPAGKQVRGRGRGGARKDPRDLVAKHKAARAVKPVTQAETVKANAFLDKFITSFKDKQNPNFTEITAFMEQFNTPEEIQAVLLNASPDKVTATMLVLVEMISPFLQMATMFQAMQPAVGPQSMFAPSQPVGEPAGEPTMVGPMPVDMSDGDVISGGQPAAEALPLPHFNMQNGEGIYDGGSEHVGNLPDGALRTAIARAPAADSVAVLPAPAQISPTAGFVGIAQQVAAQAQPLVKQVVNDGKVVAVQAGTQAVNQAKEAAKAKANGFWSQISNRVKGSSGSGVNSSGN